jgi:hypothetical protein
VRVVTGGTADGSGNITVTSNRRSRCRAEHRGRLSDHPKCVMALVTDQSKLNAIDRSLGIRGGRSPASGHSVVKTIAPPRWRRSSPAKRSSPARCRSRRATAATPIRVWGGYGVTRSAATTYLPLGDRGWRSRPRRDRRRRPGHDADLSGVEPAALALLDPDEVKGASVVVYRLIFASDGKTLLDAHVFDRGRGDTLDTVETIGGRGGDQIRGRKRRARPGPQRRAHALGFRPAADQPHRRLFQEHRLCRGKDALLGRQEADAHRRGGGGVSPPTGHFGA